MTIQPIGSASVALYITPADLKEHNLTPAELTLERALELTQSAFRAAGMTMDGSIEIEAYPDACGVLVFAHVKVPERLWFSFTHLEALLAGICALPDPPEEAALIWWDGRWWLSLPGEDTQSANLLSEFGQAGEQNSQLEASLTEHGTAILSTYAVATLRSYFSSPVSPENTWIEPLTDITDMV